MSSLKFSQTQDIIDTLKREYKSSDIVLKDILYKGQIAVFLIRFQTEGELQKEWENVSELIASYYQPYLKDEFSRWNIYLIYLFSQKLSIELKYCIENDRFSSRKIVLDENAVVLNDLNVDDIVKKYITNEDLKLSLTITRARKNKAVYNSDSKIWQVIKELDLKKIKSSQDVVNQTLETIETQLKNEIETRRNTSI